MLEILIQIRTILFKCKRVAKPSSQPLRPLDRQLSTRTVQHRLCHLFKLFLRRELQVIISQSTYFRVPVFENYSSKVKNSVLNCTTEVTSGYQRSGMGQTLPPLTTTMLPVIPVSSSTGILQLILTYFDFILKIWKTHRILSTNKHCSNRSTSPYFCRKLELRHRSVG